ncbi:TerB family tellurite resistance protein [uncultured Polaribacter sp.]|uniref:tellurite resistance TerB family protein n=1 Tax=uncultured Polaribacter sp. TaxID=174711 RepID=UPI00260B6B58|nr:TerB family tellurite resistance protein [uncultured Polaribacter sp.]
MGLSEIYTNGKQKQNRGHFANIVKIAKADDKITEEEYLFLNCMAKSLNLSVLSFCRILENPESFPINPPTNFEERIARLRNLTHMILADGDVTDKQVKLLNKIAVGLGFSSKNVTKVCQRALELAIARTDLDTFIKEVSKVNRARD